ncbi:condensation domain-containing protein, partial [Segetibacter aerophilus]|uniref:condensation domain-containing protein n=1 Tax=Segetibacter aerophilus TaxID=670293 RepID=UPI001FE9720B
MKEAFTKVIELLYLAKQDEVEIILNDGRLQLKVPDNKDIDQKLLDQIRANKESLIDFLSKEDLKLRTVDSNQKIIKAERNSQSFKIPLSFSQERLWFIDQLEGSLQYHITAVLRLKGIMNKNAVEHALNEIVNRHEILRTVYIEEDGEPWQRVKPENEWKLTTTSGTGYLEDKTGLYSYIQNTTRSPFNLAKDYMLRSELITLAEEEHLLVVTMHHIASDAWSTPIFVKELGELYTAYADGRSPNLNSLPIQYSDYAIWQRSYLQEELLNRKLDYWKKKLDDVAPLQLPLDYKRPAVSSNRGASALFMISPELRDQLRILSQRNAATLYMTLLSAFKVLLYRYSGQEDVCVGTSIAGRPQAELEGLIGFFVNTLALRSNVSGKISFNNLLQQVRQTMLEAYGNQEVPFERVVEAVVKDRDISRNPLFQVMLVLRNTPDVPELRLGNLLLSGEPYEHTTVKFELTFFMTESPRGIQGSVLYSTDLFKRDRIDRMMEHFTSLLESIVASPDQSVGSLSILRETEDKLLKEQFSCAS